MKGTKDFMEKLRTVKVPKGYQMLSFGVKTSFTNVSLEYTIDLVLKQIYKNHEILTSITRNEMREILLLCTKIYIYIYRYCLFTNSCGRYGFSIGASIGWNIYGSFRKVFSSLTYSRAQFLETICG